MGQRIKPEPQPRRREAGPWDPAEADAGLNFKRLLPFPSAADGQRGHRTRRGVHGTYSGQPGPGNEGTHQRGRFGRRDVWEPPSGSMEGRLQSLGPQRPGAPRTPSKAPHQPPWEEAALAGGSASWRGREAGAFPGMRARVCASRVEGDEAGAGREIGAQETAEDVEQSRGAFRHTRKPGRAHACEPRGGRRLAEREEGLQTHSGWGRAEVGLKDSSFHSSGRHPQPGAPWSEASGQRRLGEAA